MRIRWTLYLLPLLCAGLLIQLNAQRKPLGERPNQRIPEQDRKQQRENPEQSQAVVRQVFDDLFTRGRYDLIDKVYAPGCTVHQGNRTYRLEESVAEGKGWRSAAPDLQMTAERMSVQGDMVTVAWTARGTHTGRGNGLMKPTGKHILIHGNSRFRVVNGKIAEVWNNFDRNEIFRQLGVSPTMAFLYDETEGLRLAVNRALSGTPAP